jgi:hypothetical protein
MRIRPLTRQHHLTLHNRVDSWYIYKPRALRYSLKQSGYGGHRQTSLCRRLGDLGRVGRHELAVYEGVEDGEAECTADRASGEGETGRGGEKGAEGRELDEGDEEGEGPRLADAGEDVEADLGVAYAGGYDAVADRDDEEDEDQRRFEVFEFCCV